MVRTGIGYDCHRLQEGDGVVLGGVKIACAYAIVAHSDGDVIVHALCDALLGAAALGDLGQHFPDTDPQYRGISSLKLLALVRDLLLAKNYRINNIDVTVILEQPFVSPFKSSMRENLAYTLNILQDAVSVKATRPEQLGALGRKEGLAAMAIATLENQGAL